MLHERCVTHAYNIRPYSIKIWPNIAKIVAMRYVYACAICICDRTSENGPSGHKLHVIIK